MKARLLLVVFLLLCGISFGQQYFPEHAFDKDDKLNQNASEWYSARLKAFQEPSLWKLSKTHEAGEVYRFLWMRSFHPTLVVRLTVQADGSGILIAKTGTPLVPDQPETVATQQSTVLSKNAVAVFMAQVDRDDYWKLPTREPVAPNTYHADGAEWVVEAIRNGNYKIVDRWSPKDGPIREIGLAMIQDLAQIKLQEREIY